MIFAGGRVLDRRRADDTNSWDRVAGFTNRVHEDQHFVAFDPNDAQVVYLANDGGVYRSSDMGVTFGVEDSTLAAEVAARRNLNQGLVTAEFYRAGVVENHSLGDLYHSGIIGSQYLDGGSWKGVEGHAWEFRPILADLRRDDRYFVLGNELRVRLFPVGGTGRKLLRFGAFKTVPASGFERIVGAIAVDRRSTSNIILAAADRDDQPHRLMITRQGDRRPEYDEASDSWNNLPDWQVAFATGTADGDKISAVAFARLSPKAYAMTLDGRVFVNEDVDASADWNRGGQWLGRGGGIRQMVVSPADRDLVYAIRDESVGRSREAGAPGSWESVGGAELPATDINSIAVHPRNGFTVFLGSEDGVYMSVDQGDRWEPIDNSLPNASVRQIYVSGQYLYAVTHGRGLWRLPLCAIPRGA